MFRLWRLLLLFIALTLYNVSSLNAQQTIYEEPTTLFTKSLHGGVHIHPRGWGLNFAYGDIQSIDKTRYYSLEILGMKHSKEVKQVNSFSEDASAYSYGKLNAFYIVRPAIKVKRKITNKYRKSGVEVSLTTGIGPSFGLTKPIYLEIGGPVIPQLPPSVERYNPEIHSVNNIRGKASALRGFDELKLWPGIHANTSLYFEMSPYQKQIKGVEAGVLVDAYLEKIPLMALEENNQFFFSFYINLFIGRKYNRSISE